MNFQIDTMDTNIRAMLRIVAILTLFIAIGWYGDLDHVRKIQTISPEEHGISYNTAKARLTPPIYASNKYYYQNVTTVTYTRTLIPFVYSDIKDSKTNTWKQYYSRGTSK